MTASQVATSGSSNQAGATQRYNANLSCDCALMILVLGKDECKWFMVCGSYKPTRLKKIMSVLQQGKKQYSYAYVLATETC